MADEEKRKLRLKKGESSCVDSLRLAVLTVAIALTLWRTCDCVTKYLQFRRESEILLMESKSTIMPAFTICPNYDSSYNETRLRRLGIAGRDAYRRKGCWEGNSGAGQRGVFDMVAHKLGEIVESMEFLMVHDGKENKTMLSGNQLQHLLEAREILNPTYGRCFEIDLAKLNQTIESVSIATHVPIYLYVNIPGQFHNGDSYSKIEVLLQECLFIELTYEILIQNDASTCRKFNKSETYDECSERAALENLTGDYGCTAPYLTSPPCLPICQGQEKAKQVEILLIS